MTSDNLKIPKLAVALYLLATVWILLRPIAYKAALGIHEIDLGSYYDSTFKRDISYQEAAEYHTATRALAYLLVLFSTFFLASLSMRDNFYRIVGMLFGILPFVVFLLALNNVYSFFVI